MDPAGMARTEASNQDGESAPTGRRRVRWGLVATLIPLVLVATAVRIWASAGDFWLDEIWSLVLATKHVSSPLELITKIQHDNNHILNTLFMYLLGHRDAWLIYRVPAIVAGVAAVVVSGVIARRRGAADAVITMVVTGSSYLLIHYSSEARGYAPAVLFALLSLLFMHQYLEGKRWAACGFALAVILGFLSHLTFVHAYVALALWSVWRFVKDRRTWRGVVLNVVSCHAVPLAFIVLFYLVHVRHIQLGGAPPYSLWDVVVSTAALTLGVPETPRLALIALVAGLVILGCGLACLWRERSDTWLFYSVAILLSPALLVILRPPDFLFPRYFLVNVAFYLLLLGYVLAWLYRRGRVGRVACGLLLTLFVAGNSLHTAGLISRGRGEYLTALRYLLAHSTGRVITVGSDHDFRNRMVMAFYLQRLPKDKSLIYLQSSQWPETGVQWYFAHSLDRTFRPSPQMTDPAGNTYELAQSFDYSGLSGWRWFLYRGSAPETPTSSGIP